MNMNDSMTLMNPAFDGDLHAGLKGECVWHIDVPLRYRSVILGEIVVPVGFQTDLASVPRVPIFYEAWGNRAHREAVIHDYLYRYDSWPQATKQEADSVFLEAMKSRGVKLWIRWPMYWGVVLGGHGGYHKMSVSAELWPS